MFSAELRVNPVRYNFIEFWLLFEICDSFLVTWNLEFGICNNLRRFDANTSKSEQR